MFRYIKRRYAASVDARSNAAAKNWVDHAGTGRWSGIGHPFAHHRLAVISALAEGVAAIYGYDVPGDIAEFGTMSGETATGLSHAIAACDEYMNYASVVYGHAPRELFLLDSFVGLPAVQNTSIDGQSPHVRDGVWSSGSLVGISVEELVAKVTQHMPVERVHVLPGWFSDTVPTIPDSRRFALLHIDSDLYQSAMDVLDSLLSRGMISNGAYVYFDDWNCNGANPEFGERRAWRECVERYNIRFSDLGIYGIFAQRFVIHSYDAPQSVRAGNLPATAVATALPAASVAATAASPEASSSDEQHEPPSTHQEVPTSTSQQEPTSTDQPEPTSTDVYDHQAASRHYHQVTGMADMDAPFLPIYERCRPYSMTSADRLYAVYKAVEYLQKAGIEGDFVECGVWRGGSMMVAAEALKIHGHPERVMHLFDTYEGLPEPGAEDVDVWGHDAATWWVKKKKSERSSDWARSHLAEVEANMALTGFPADRIRFVKGMVEDTIPAAAPEKIALLRLDTDWYASTRHELEHLFPRLVRNGVLIIDDYGHFKGARQAVDEYLAEAGMPIMLMRVDYTGRIALKTHGSN